MMAPTRIRGVEGAPGVLEHGLYGGAVFAAVGAAEGFGVLAVEAHNAVGGGFHLQHHTGGGGFAAAGFAHQAVGFALADAEGDAVHGFDLAYGAAGDDALGDGEVLADVFQFNDGVGAVAPARAGGGVGGAGCGCGVRVRIRQRHQRLSS